MDIKTRHFIEERLLTTQEVAELLHVPVVTVQQWAARHKVDGVIKGRTYLFDRKDFEDFVRPGTAGRPGRKAKVVSSTVAATVTAAVTMEDGADPADPLGVPLP